MVDKFHKLKERLKQLKKTEPAFKTCPELLLLPNIPKPLHGLTPREILGREWWDETRQAAYASTDYRCLACGVKRQEAKYHQWLEGHEVYETDYTRGRLIYIETVPLCHSCHNFIHDGRMQNLVAKNQMTREKYNDVLTNGQAILKAAGLRKQDYMGEIAPWSSWRLVLFGKEYEPSHVDFEAWRNFYSRGKP